MKPISTDEELEAVVRRTYTDPDCVRFCSDMEQAGLDPEHYRGRWFWEGPAVSVDSLQDAMRHTDVKLQWDNLGLGFIVYPVASDGGVEA